MLVKPIPSPARAEEVITWGSPGRRDGEVSRVLGPLRWLPEVEYWPSIYLCVRYDKELNGTHPPPYLTYHSRHTPSLHTHTEPIWVPRGALGNVVTVRVP